MNVSMGMYCIRLIYPPGKRVIRGPAVRKSRGHAAGDGAPGATWQGRGTGNTGRPVHPSSVPPPPSSPLFLDFFSLPPPRARVLFGDLPPLVSGFAKAKQPVRMVEVEEVGNKMQAQMRLHRGPEEDADLPLPALFDRASRLHSLASNSSLDQEGIREGVDLLRRCDEMLSKLALFSSNETKDDVSTANLKYLLVPYYIGEMTEKAAQEDRIPILKASQDHLKEFISICEALELIPEDELELSRQRQPDTMANQRAQKVARFRRQKAAETKLQEIKERKERRGRSLRAAALSAPIEAGEEDALEDDGEEEREAWLATISLALFKAFDLLDMLKQEEEMLLAVKERQAKDGNAFAREMLDERTKKAEAWHHNAANRAPYSKPADPITCATLAQDIIEGRASVSQAHEHKHQPLIFGPASLVGGGLTSVRERTAAQVFQPGYRMPTMSIEEAGLREMKMMKEWQEKTAEMIQDANSAWYKDGTRSAQEDEDAEEEKARAWDDWKDDNPRGAGNKKLTPCG